MDIPEELQVQIDLLFFELDETEKLANNSLDLIRPLLNQFPENNLLLQLFASVNNTKLFVEISRRRIEIPRNRLARR